MTAPESTTSNNDRSSQLAEVVIASRWLAEGVVRRNPLRMALISLAALAGAFGTAFGTLAVIFYLRAAAGDGSLGPFAIEIGDPTDPITAGTFLIGLVIVVCIAAWAVWWSDRAIAELARKQAARIRTMIVSLLGDPASAGWQSAVEHRRPAQLLYQAMVARVRSSTIAITEILGLGPAILTLVVSLIVMVVIDPFATFLALPIAGLFGVIGERINREVASLTQTYDGRLERTRDQLVEQLEDLSEGYIGADEVSFSRADTDDSLFHDRQLASTKLQALSLVNGAFMFAVIAAYFILVDGIEDFSIELLIAYTFAVRFAARSVQQTFRAMVQVSRRLEEIRTVHTFIATVDAHRYERTIRAETADELPTTLSIDVGHGSTWTIDRKRPMLVLINRPPDDSEAWTVLHVVETAAATDGLDLIGSARIVEVTEDNPVPDMLASEPVRVIVTDDPSPLVSESRQAFTFIVHNRPKLVLAKATQDLADRFGGVLVIVGDEIVWSGTVAQAKPRADHIRDLLKPRNARARASTTPGKATP